MQVALSQSSTRQIPNAVLGMMFFLAVETMLFCGLMSSFVVIRANHEFWPPVGQPRLPATVTGINTLILLGSGLAMIWARRALIKGQRGALMYRLTCALALGALFLAVQGVEWTRLVHFGLTLQSSRYGAIFYFLIGMHGVHVLGGLLTLAFVWQKTRRGRYEYPRDCGGFYAAMMYWLFVVGLWPALYALVYLA